MQVLLDMDARQGVVHVIGRPKRSIVGAIIRSPIAAGRASLLVANRERLDDAKNQNQELKREIKQKVLRRRWLGDAVHLKRTSFSEPAREAERFSLAIRKSPLEASGTNGVDIVLFGE